MRDGAGRLCSAVCGCILLLLTLLVCAAARLRAKKRNMERLTLACGGFAINSVEELSPDCLVRAGGGRGLA
jgi:hypothetical protein